MTLFSRENRLIFDNNFDSNKKKLDKKESKEKLSKPEEFNVQEILDYYNSLEKYGEPHEKVKLGSLIEQIADIEKLNWLEALSKITDDKKLDDKAKKQMALEYLKHKKYTAQNIEKLEQNEIESWDDLVVELESAIVSKEIKAELSPEKQQDVFHTHQFLLSEALDSIVANDILSKDDVSDIKNFQNLSAKHISTLDQRHQDIILSTQKVLSAKVESSKKDESTQKWFEDNWESLAKKAIRARGFINFFESKTKGIEDALDTAKNTLENKSIKGMLWEAVKTGVKTIATKHPYALAGLLLYGAAMFVNSVRKKGFTKTIFRWGLTLGGFAGGAVLAGHIVGKNNVQSWIKKMGVELLDDKLKDSSKNIQDEAKKVEQTVKDGIKNTLGDPKNVEDAKKNLTEKADKKLLEFLTKEDNEQFIALKKQLRKPVEIAEATAKRGDFREVYDEEFDSWYNYIDNLEKHITEEEYKQAGGDPEKFRQLIIKKATEHSKKMLEETQKKGKGGDIAFVKLVEAVQEGWSKPGSIVEHADRQTYKLLESVPAFAGSMLKNMATRFVPGTLTKLSNHYERNNQDHHVENLTAIIEKWNSEQELTMSDRLDILFYFLDAGYKVTIDGPVSYILDPDGTKLEVIGLFGYTEDDIKHLGDAVVEAEKAWYGLMRTRLANLVIKVWGKALYGVGSGIGIMGKVSEKGADALAKAFQKGTETLKEPARILESIKNATVALSNDAKGTYNGLMSKLPFIGQQYKADLVKALTGGTTAVQAEKIMNDFIKHANPELAKQGRQAQLIFQSTMKEVAMVYANQKIVLDINRALSEAAQLVSEGKPAKDAFKNIDKLFGTLQTQINQNDKAFQSVTQGRGFKGLVGHQFRKTFSSFYSGTALWDKANNLNRLQYLFKAEAGNLRHTLEQLEKGVKVGTNVNTKSYLESLQKMNTNLKELNQMQRGMGAKELFKGFQTFGGGVKEIAKTAIAEGFNTFFVVEGVREFMETGDWWDAVDKWSYIIPIGGSLRLIMPDGIVEFRRDENGEITIWAKEDEDPGIAKLLGQYIRNPFKTVGATLGTVALMGDTIALGKAFGKGGFTGLGKELVIRPLTAPGRVVKGIGKGMKMMIYDTGGHIVESIKKGVGQNFQVEVIDGGIPSNTTPTETTKATPKVVDTVEAQKARVEIKEKLPKEVQSKINDLPAEKQASVLDDLAETSAKVSKTEFDEVIEVVAKSNIDDVVKVSKCARMWGVIKSLGVTAMVGFDFFSSYNLYREADEMDKLIEAAQSPEFKQALKDAQNEKYISGGVYGALPTQVVTFKTLEIAAKMYGKEGLQKFFSKASGLRLGLGSMVIITGAIEGYVYAKESLYSSYLEWSKEAEDWAMETPETLYAVLSKVTTSQGSELAKKLGYLDEEMQHLSKGDVREKIIEGLILQKYGSYERDQKGKIHFETSNFRNIKSKQSHIQAMNAWAYIHTALGEDFEVESALQAKQVIQEAWRYAELRSSYIPTLIDGKPLPTADNGKLTPQEFKHIQSAVRIKSSTDVRESIDALLHNKDLSHQEKNSVGYIDQAFRRLEEDGVTITEMQGIMSTLNNEAYYQEVIGTMSIQDAQGKNVEHQATVQDGLHIISELQTLYGDFAPEMQPIGNRAYAQKWLEYYILGKGERPSTLSSTMTSESIYEFAAIVLRKRFGIICDPHDDQKILQAFFSESRSNINGFYYSPDSNQWSVQVAGGADQEVLNGGDLITKLKANSPYVFHRDMSKSSEWIWRSDELKAKTTEDTLDIVELVKNKERISDNGEVLKKYLHEYLGKYFIFETEEEKQWVTDNVVMCCQHIATNDSYKAEEAALFLESIKTILKDASKDNTVPRFYRDHTKILSTETLSQTQEKLEKVFGRYRPLRYIGIKDRAEKVHFEILGNNKYAVIGNRAYEIDQTPQGENVIEYKGKQRKVHSISGNRGYIDIEKYMLKVGAMKEEVELFELNYNEDLNASTGAMEQLEYMVKAISSHEDIIAVYFRGGWGIVVGTSRVYNIDARYSAGGKFFSSSQKSMKLSRQNWDELDLSDEHINWVKDVLERYNSQFKGQEKEKSLGEYLNIQKVLQNQSAAAEKSWIRVPGVGEVTVVDENGKKQLYMRRMTPPNQEFKAQDKTTTSNWYITRYLKSSLTVNSNGQLEHSWEELDEAPEELRNKDLGFEPKTDDIKKLLKCYEYKVDVGLFGYWNTYHNKKVTADTVKWFKNFNGDKKQAYIHLYKKLEAYGKPIDHEFMKELKK